LDYFKEDKMNIDERTFEFALDIIELYKYIINKNEYILSKQLIRSGTSIGANIQEAQAAETKKDFIAKMSIASKEARETLYWLRLLDKSGYLKTYNNADIIIDKTKSIINIITKIIITAKKNLSNEK
jgi:four helix bundle protein